MTRKLRLGINIDHVATLRNARGGDMPCPVAAARVALAAGADGITAHLREDRRHIRDRDLERLRAEIPLPLNMEMAVTAEMVAIATRLRPHAVCLVPEKRTEITTEGGLDVVTHQADLTPAIADLAGAGCRVSLFIDPDLRQVDAAKAVGAAVVELHTGAYAHAGASAAELMRLQQAAEYADKIGLECHAGHGLTTANVGPVAAIGVVQELNIGHFIIGEAIFWGLEEAIRRMRDAMRLGRGI
jgi:pyridoxine 5-phosphate synthase